MRAIHLDYQRRYRAFPVGGFLLLGAVLVAVGLIARQYLEFGELLAAWEARADQLEQAGGHRRGEAVRRPPGASAGRDLARANDVLRRVTLPWDQLFRDIESAAVKDVALLALEPDADRQVLKITGEAKDVAALFAYMRAIEATPAFGAVVLSNHQIQQQDPQRPIRFTLLANWRTP